MRQELDRSEPLVTATIYGHWFAALDDQFGLYTTRLHSLLRYIGVIESLRTTDAPLVH